MKKESIFPLFRGWKLREKVKSCTCFRYAFALCLICMTSLVFAQEKKLSYKWEEKSLSDVLNTLEKVGVYKFVFTRLPRGGRKKVFRRFWMSCYRTSRWRIRFRGNTC